MISRGIFYIVTITAILLLLGFVTNFFCIIFNIDIRDNNFIGLLVLFALIGFGGSLISLYLSKYTVKKLMKVYVITNPTTQTEKWLVETIRLLAIKKGVEMPEVGIYNSTEMNAFATGPSKNNSLVAVSTGLLDRMEQDEIEAVLGHEMSHVANGDMVTQCLLQGIINTFVYSLAYFIAGLLTSNKSNRREHNDFMFYTLNGILQTFFGLLGSLIVFWFSRIREYRADAGSADIFGKEAMIKALLALKVQKVQPKPDSVKALCINGVSSLSVLFMTHPPIDKRIEALKKRSK